MSESGKDGITSFEMIIVHLEYKYTLFPPNVVDSFLIAGL